MFGAVLLLSSFVGDTGQFGAAINDKKRNRPLTFQPNHLGEE